LEARASDVIEQAVADAEALPQPTGGEMLSRMYAEPTAPLSKQMDEIEA
jgi:TPP-dependent pyruvate/acetoin dehydrogenase alpha subunit